MKKEAGFTLVELITVLIIVAALSAVALPRFFNKPVFDVRGYGDQISALIRYGQKMAVAQNLNVYVQLSGARVALCYDSACAKPVPAVSGANSGSSVTIAACGNSAWACEGTPVGVAFTAANGSSVSYISASSARFYYSAQGRPYNTGDTLPNTGFTSMLTLNITGDGGNHPLYIERETGYVHR